MKTFKILSLLMFCSIILFFSCKKDSPDPATPNHCDTVRIHDTIVATPLTNTQILAQKDWQVDELYTDVSGSTKHFVRGGVNTTGTTYGNMRFHFNADGTGTYIDQVNISHSLIWSFTTTDERNMSLTIGAPSAQTFYWNMLEVNDNYIHSSSPSANTMLSARYIQIP